MTSHADPSSQRNRRAPRRKRSTARLLLLTGSAVLLLTIAGLTVAGVVMYWMWQSTPAHWQAVQRFKATHDPRDIERMAASVENHAAMRLSDIDTDATNGVSTRTLRLSFNQINAWLDRRLDDWLANQGAAMPDGLEDLMLTSKDGDLVLALRARNAQVDQVFSFVFAVNVQPDGRVRLKIKEVLAGTLPMPTEPAGIRVRGVVLRGVCSRGSSPPR